jgi:uncharacterized protein YdeI (YjbR/CyaY-like superfamily)
VAKKLHELEQVYVPDRQSWRDWLSENHKSSPGIWLVYYKKASGKLRVAYSDAVEEALCYGWIDSTVKTIDEERSFQLFTPRKKGSTWSKLNKQRVEKLQKEGLMTPAGLACINIAKENGMWEILDSVEALIMPEELETALKENKKALENFSNFSNSIKKGIYWWIISAKTAATRLKRIEKTLTMAEVNKRAQFDK